MSIPVALRCLEETICGDVEQIIPNANLKANSNPNLNSNPNKFAWIRIVSFKFAIKIELDKKRLEKSRN